MSNAKQEKYELIITANSVTSTDDRFSMDDLGKPGDGYKPLDSYYINTDGEIIRRKYNKGEKRNCNQTLPRLAFQIFERPLVALSVDEKENFPVCQYTPNHEIIRGIYSSVEAIKQAHRTSLQYCIYNCGDGKQFFFHSWGIFSTIMFVQECLRRFGGNADKFILIYREKDKKEAVQPENVENIIDEQVMEFSGYINPYSNELIVSKNIIFRGAPGTGKTYLAKEVAADIISNGYFSDYTLLSEEQKKQIEFIQFHPSYDYTDFVEGIRPIINNDGSMGFELQDGVFKKFITRAKKNYDDAHKTQEVIEKEASVQEVIDDYFSKIELGIDVLKTIRGTEFYISDINDNRIKITIPENTATNNLTLSIDKLSKMLESGQEFTIYNDVKQ